MVLLVSDIEAKLAQKGIVDSLLLKIETLLVLYREGAENRLGQRVVFTAAELLSLETLIATTRTQLITEVGKL